jgi:hypothetical protein
LQPRIAAQLHIVQVLLRYIVQRVSSQFYIVQSDSSETIVYGNPRLKTTRLQLHRRL